MKSRSAASGWGYRCVVENRKVENDFQENGNQSRHWQTAGSRTHTRKVIRSYNGRPKKRGLKKARPQKARVQKGKGKRKGRSSKVEPSVIESCNGWLAARRPGGPRQKQTLNGFIRWLFPITLLVVAEERRGRQIQETADENTSRMRLKRTFPL